MYNNMCTPVVKTFLYVSENENQNFSPGHGFQIKYWNLKIMQYYTDS